MASIVDEIKKLEKKENHQGLKIWYTKENYKPSIGMKFQQIY